MMGASLVLVLRVTQLSPRQPATSRPGTSCRAAQQGELEPPSTSFRQDITLIHQSSDVSWVWPSPVVLGHLVHGGQLLQRKVTIIHC